MRELPGDVFVAGQLLPEHIESLAGQGVMSFINNRPDNEVPGQPTNAFLRQTAEAAGATYAYIPMAGALTPDLLARSEEAFRTLPRPIIAFCASGSRSAALWAFAHAENLGLDATFAALAEAGYPHDMLRPHVKAHILRKPS